MPADTSSPGSSSSSGGSDSQGEEHPVDTAVRRRAADIRERGGGAVAVCGAAQEESLSAESGEVPFATSRQQHERGVCGGQTKPSRSDGKDKGAHNSDALVAQNNAPLGDSGDALASACHASNSSGTGNVDAELVEPAVPLAPTGVVLVEGAEERNAEVQRLLRGPRYFDEDFEEAGLRCFKCGGKGHFARDCTAEAKERSCFLCAQFGHDSRDCPNSLCWRCQRPGHMARDCPYGYRKQASWDEASAAACLRCGSGSCPCAGEKDFFRAEGGCKQEYTQRDLQHVHCYACGRRGHLSCATTPTQLAKLSCANCGQGGHTAGECTRELPQVMRGERFNARSASQLYGNDRGASGGGFSAGGAGYSSGGYGNGGGRPRFANYSAYAEIDQRGSGQYANPDFYRGGGGFKRLRH